MQTRTEKIVNGMRVKLPADYVRDAKLKEGDIMIVKWDGVELTLIPGKVVPKLTATQREIDQS